MQQPVSNAQLRYAIIGGGASIARTHLEALKQLPGALVVGLCDVDAVRGAAAAELAGCPFFPDHHTMLAALLPDVAIVCTPHTSHPGLAIDALASGAHVLVEKPLAVQVSDADAMIEAADRAERLLAVNFQQRFRPAIEYMRAFIEAGSLGPLLSVQYVESWYRTAAYYRGSAWRGTWRGEGGAVLLNQAPHPLDLLCHVCGLPQTVWGMTRTVRHAIECEDTAVAMLEWAGDATGTLRISTVEAGGSRFEIVGERAALELAGNTLTVRRFDPPLDKHRAMCPEPFAAPSISTEVVALPPDESGGHVAVHRDLANAIALGLRPRADGREGRMSLELANAITLSSHAGRPVRLPLDRGEYAALLSRLRGE